jgi:tRNA(fMet)-specific endonuclease VapC
MIYLLDANACIRLLNGTSPPLIARFRAAVPSRIRLCSVVKTELIFGAHKSLNAAAALQKLRRFFGPMKSLPFDDACAEHAGRIRADLERVGAMLGPMDLLIAATALEFNATLVTHNIREFGRVIGLHYEDWELPR